MAENGWTRFWRELWRRMVAYFDQSQVGNQASAETALEAAETIKYGHTAPEAVERVESGEAPPAQALQSGTDAKSAGAGDTEPPIGLDYVYGGSQLANNISGQTENLAAQSRENYAAYLRSKDLLEMQQDFSERMSNSAIQRQVADAQAAGINPYYLFGGGTSGAGVSAASGASQVSAPSSGGNSGAMVASTIGSFAQVVSAIIKALA